MLESALTLDMDALLRDCENNNAVNQRVRNKKKKRRAADTAVRKFNGEFSYGKFVNTGDKFIL